MENFSQEYATRFVVSLIFLFFGSSLLIGIKGYLNIMEELKEDKNYLQSGNHMGLDILSFIGLMSVIAGVYLILFMLGSLFLP